MLQPPRGAGSTHGWRGGGCSPLHQLSPEPPGTLGTADLLLHHVEGVEDVDGELHKHGTCGTGVKGPKKKKKDPPKKQKKKCVSRR